jgi:hypothetical protein
MSVGDHDKFASLKIMCHSYLPPCTILVSSDVWEACREAYTEEGRDRAFLRDLKIGEPGKESP